MASDTPAGRDDSGNNFNVSIVWRVIDEFWIALQRPQPGGKVRLPLSDMFVGRALRHAPPTCGIQWMFNYDLPK